MPHTNMPAAKRSLRRFPRSRNVRAGEAEVGVALAEAVLYPFDGESSDRSDQRATVRRH